MWLIPRESCENRSGPRINKEAEVPLQRPPGSPLSLTWDENGAALGVRAKLPGVITGDGMGFLTSFVPGGHLRKPLILHPAWAWYSPGHIGRCLRTCYATGAMLGDLHTFFITSVPQHPQESSITASLVQIRERGHFIFRAFSSAHMFS